jgi:hypothetical protein
MTALSTGATYAWSLMTISLCATVATRFMVFHVSHSSSGRSFLALVTAAANAATASSMSD